MILGGTSEAQERTAWPRGRLNEKHVQRVAVEWLASYYADKGGVQAVHAELGTVVSANSKLGRKRAARVSPDLRQGRVRPDRT